jgi:tRNA (cytidine/uridine-2'-O-)-methyltransferase
MSHQNKDSSPVVDDPDVCSPVQRHVVLVAPEVHWNTGNIGRTCLGAGAVLHLVRPLGFSLDDRHLKRAGLDYWDNVRLHTWDDFGCFLDQMRPRDDELVLLTRKGRHPYWQMPAQQRLFLVFGSETLGLPEHLLERYRFRTYYIPISKAIRCLNLSTAVGIALYETLRGPFSSDRLSL